MDIWAYRYPEYGVSCFHKSNTRSSLPVESQKGDREAQRPDAISMQLHSYHTQYRVLSTYVLRLHPPLPGGSLQVFLILLIIDTYYYEIHSTEFCGVS